MSHGAVTRSTLQAADALFAAFASGEAIAPLAEDLAAPLLPRPQVVDRASLMLGDAGVYSSFLLHTERAAARYAVDPRDILVELGRRGIVGGQEDMILDVAASLATAAANVH